MANRGVPPEPERVLADVRLSWWLIFRSFGTFLAALLTLGLSAYFARRASALTITDRRLILRRGLLQRKTVEMELGRVAQVEVTSGLFDRLLGIGGLTVIALDQFQFRLYPLRRTEALKDILMGAVAESRRALGGGAQAVAVTVPAPASERKEDVLAAIERLGQLRDKGVVSPAEFEKKKNELLARL
jgi:membrane protein YdbS with pleckstrin-like domain